VSDYEPEKNVKPEQEQKTDKAAAVSRNESKRMNEKNNRERTFTAKKKMMKSM